MGKKEPPPVCRPRGGGDHMILKYIVSISQRWEKVNERYPN